MAGSKKESIKFFLTFDSSNFDSKLSAAQKKLSFTAKKVAKDWKPVTGIFTRTGKSITLAAAAAGTAAAAGGFYALQSVLRSSVTEALSLDAAMYNMSASLEAANRQFDLGSVTSWETALAGMRKELKIFSETDLRNASARTIDMTKRLGLSADQMKKVMVAAANLGAGKFALVDSVERVTAALRGEAEASEALGLTLNENYVKAWYQVHDATGKAWKDLTDLEKAQVRYNVLLEQAGAATGRAAGAYNTMSGVSSALASSYNELKTSIGKVVTQNTFFVQDGQLVDGMLKKWKVGIDANTDDWMVWAKQSTLAVLEFAASAVEGVAMTFGMFNALNKTLRLAYTSILRLTSGYLAYQKVLAMLAGDEEKVKKVHRQRLELQYDIQQSFEDVMASDESANKAAEYAEKAATKIRSLKDALAKIEAKPIDDTATATDDAAKAMEGYEKKVVKVGDTWTETWVKTENESEKSIDKQEKGVHGLGNTWEKVWKDATTYSDDFFDNAMRNLKNLQAEAAKGIGSHAAGGVVGAGFAVGGRVTGPGGIDNVPAWLTAGEVVIKEPSVKAAGLRASLAFNTGNWPVVIEELTRRVRGFQLGGLVGRLPALPDIQKFAGGGPVLAGVGGGGTVTINLSDAAAGERATAYASQADAATIERMFKRRNRLASR